MESIAAANLGISQATVATLGTVMIIGLGFVSRPSRSSLLWSLAFILALVSTWVSLAGEALADETLRRVGLGAMLGAPALIWSGFRARRNRPSLPWIALVQAAASAVILVIAGDSEWYGLIFRVLFLGAAVFPGLTLYEVWRSPDRHERLVLPLTLVSGAFVTLGVFSVIAGLVFPLGEAADLELVRALNSLGMLIYLVCATVTLLFFTSVSTGQIRNAQSWPQFSVTAADRLRRARLRGEASWAMLVIRLDDPDDIRGVVGEAAFETIVRRFEQTVADAFPSEADIGRESAGRLVVVLCRPGPVIREHVRTTLRAVTAMDASQQIAVQLSASVGWAPAEIAGYQFDAMLASAQAAAAEAVRRGGDRWERLGT